jgi:hypothetical protein
MINSKISRLPNEILSIIFKFKRVAYWDLRRKASHQVLTECFTKRQVTPPISEGYDENSYVLSVKGLFCVDIMWYGDTLSYDFISFTNRNHCFRTFVLPDKIHVSDTSNILAEDLFYDEYTNEDFTEED